MTRIAASTDAWDRVTIYNTFCSTKAIRVPALMEKRTDASNAR